MPDRFRFEDVSRALRSSWSTKTSGGWLADNPARGQCNVTALLVNDLFGGDMLKTPLPDGDHFYNRIGDARMDFTADQFDRPIDYADLPSDRTEALAGTTVEKYEALRSAFQATIRSICK
jgi:hypothetical protein